MPLGTQTGQFDLRPVLQDWGGPTKGTGHENFPSGFGLWVGYGTMMEDLFLSRPPRGYMPFRVDKFEEKWILATPFSDDVDSLWAAVWDADQGEYIPFEDWVLDRDVNLEKGRVLRVFDTREEALLGAWEHAKIWWGGDPPATVAAIEDYAGLPPGYAILIDNRSIWLCFPDGRVTGEISGSCLSSGLSMYGPRAWEDFNQTRA